MSLLEYFSFTIEDIYLHKIVNFSDSHIRKTYKKKLKETNLIAPIISSKYWICTCFRDRKSVV